MSSIVNYAQQSAYTKASVAATERSNYNIAMSAVANYAQLSDQAREAHEQELESSLDMQKEYLKEKGTTNNVSAAMGRAGYSVANQFRSLDNVKYNSFANIQADSQAALDNIADQADSLWRNSIAAQDATPVQRPSWFGALLNAGSEAATAYLTYNK